MNTMRFNQDIQNKNVYISGGTSGINLGIAEAFVRQGANVAVLGRNPEKTSTAAEMLKARGGGDVIGLCADVRDPDALAETLQQAVDKFGPLDVVIAGAAGNFPAPAVDISPKGFKTVIDIDLLGTYNLFRLAYPHLRPGGAALIAISAPQGSLPTPLQTHVCAAKAGINMLVKCLAMEWGPAGIRVNAISPGPINDTEGMRRLAPTPEAAEAITRKIPQRRFGEKQYIADLALYLSCDVGAYITGAIIPCDGGAGVGDASLDCLTPTPR